MYKITRLVAVIVFCLSLSSVYAYDLSKLQGIYAKSMKKIDDKHSNTELSAGISYVSSLQSLQKSVQKKGDLDGWQTIQKEVKRYRKEHKLLNKHFVSSMPELEAVQKKHLLPLSAAPIKKSKEIISLYEKYLKRLEFLQTDLTKKGKINDALQINAEIKKLKKSDRIILAKGVIAGSGDAPDANVADAGDARKEEKDPAVEEKLPVTEEINGCMVYRGKRPPRRKGISYKSFSCRPTSLARHSRAMAVSIQHSSSSVVTSSGHSSYSSSRSSRKNDYIQVSMRATGGDLENLRLYVQYFAKSVGRSQGKVVPKEVRSVMVPVKKLGADYVYVEFPPVCTEAASTTYRHSLSSSYSSSGSKSGQTFYGVVVSVFDYEGKPVYQSAGPATLDQIARKEAPNFKGKEGELNMQREKVENCKRDYDNARNTYYKDTSNQENKRKYDSARDSYYSEKRRIESMERELRDFRN